MNIKQILVKSVNGIHISFVYIAMALIIAITFITSANVFMRFFLNSGISWAEEVTKILVVWFTYISMAIGVKQGLHISLHVLPQDLPNFVVKILTVVKDVVTIVIALVMVIYGIKLIGYTSRSVMTATLWPSSVLYMILPFSGVLIISESIMDLLGVDDTPEDIENMFMGDSNGIN